MRLERNILPTVDIGASVRRHRLGVLLSVLGFVAVLTAALLLFGGGLYLAALPGDAPDRLVDTVTSLSGAFAALLCLLVATCLLIPGEQLRRGVMHHNAEQKKEHVVAKRTNVSRYRLLGAGWHALWATLGLAAVVALFLVPTLGYVNDAWPATLPPERNFAPVWQLVGLFGLGIVAASYASLYKKVHYLRLLRDRGKEILAGGENAARWRFVTYRWRLDLWLAGVGGVIAGFALTIPSLIDWSEPDDVSSGLVAAAVGVVVGAVVFLIALSLSAKFWRAGLPIGSAESFS